MRKRTRIAQGARGDERPRCLVDPEIVEAPYVGTETTGTLLFRVRIACKTSGTRGLTVRVLPHHADLGRPTEVRRIAMGLNRLAWEGPSPPGAWGRACRALPAIPFLPRPLSPPKRAT